MKYTLFILICSFLLACANQQQTSSQEPEQAENTGIIGADTLFKVSHPSSDDFCYINQKGDTLIPFGRFSYGFTDTISSYGVVMDLSGDKQVPIAINPQGEKLFEVYWFDNGPDYLEDGLFRIIQDGKIGYADETGKIVIQPQFACAHPFSEGKAQVSHECTLEQDGEYPVMKSEHWFYIDKTGAKVE